jgi:type I restriction enzyme S subunit
MSFPKRSIESVAQVERGKFSARPRNDPSYYNGPYPFIQTGDIAQSSGLVKTFSQSLNEEGLQVSKLFSKTSLVMTIAANIGDVAIVDFDFACPDSVVVIEPNRDIDRVWLKYILQLNKEGFRSLATQNAQKNINLEIIRPYQIPVPDTDTQKRIAIFLSTWDFAIEKTERLVELKEKKAHWIIEHMFLAFSGKWDYIDIETLFAVISDRNHPDEELLSVTQDRGVVPRTSLSGRVMSPTGDVSAYKLILPGDFAVSLRSFQGGLEYCEYRGIISPAYTVLRPRVAIDRDYFQVFLKCSTFVSYYLSQAVIGIRDGKQISIPDLMAISIPVPPLDLQKKIGRVAATADQEIRTMRKQLSLLISEKSFLMSKLLTGEWKAPDIEAKENQR